MLSLSSSIFINVSWI